MLIFLRIRDPESSWRLTRFKLWYVRHPDLWNHVFSGIFISFCSTLTTFFEVLICSCSVRMWLDSCCIFWFHSASPIRSWWTGIWPIWHMASLSWLIVANILSIELTRAVIAFCLISSSARWLVVGPAVWIVSSRHMRSVCLVLLSYKLFYHSTSIL